jgi:hypothetical protein
MVHGPRLGLTDGDRRRATGTNCARTVSGEPATVNADGRAAGRPPLLVCFARRCPAGAGWDGSDAESALVDGDRSDSVHRRLDGWE